MKEVSIVIVCMNRPDNLWPCLESINRLNATPCETFVVAYMFSEENLRRLREEWPGVRVVESRDLRGFSENNNLALKLVTTPFTFIVNDDTEMDMPVIDRLLEDFRKIPDAAAISPKIVFPDGRVQTCGRGPWTPWRWMRHYVSAVDETRPSRWTMQDGVFPTWTLNGACFMIRTDVFREAGFFDETYTFTPEDIALGTLLSRKGHRIYTDADAVIIHKAGATASRIEPAIKPARVRGDLIFYSSMRKLRSPQGTYGINPLLYGLLGAWVWTYEALRGIKYMFVKWSDSPEASEAERHNSIMRRTSRNVRHYVFSRLSPKEIFIRLYGK